MKDLQKSYVLRIGSAIVLSLIALTMTSSIETILHTSISVHRYLMNGITAIVLMMAAGAIYCCWRASTVDVLYTVRKIVPLALAIFPIYVFIFQGALYWMWLF